MALCRCKEHKPIGRKYNYVMGVKPIAYPNSSSICGRKKCQLVGLIWLIEKEYIDYQNGIDVFNYDSSVSKVKVIKKI